MTKQVTPKDPKTKATKTDKAAKSEQERKDATIRCHRKSSSFKSH